MIHLGPRGTGVGHTIANLPAPVTTAFAAVTVLGDPAFLLAALALLYWRAPAATPRRATVTLIGVGLAAAGAAVALKGVFTLARPPGAAETGFGFPSGHALGAAAVYGGGARLYGRLDRRRRSGVAAVVVALVACSRVVIGVHYLVDVAAGVAGGIVLAAGLDRPNRAFAAAIALGVAALALGGPTTTAEAAAGVGGSGGGWLAWRRVEIGSASVGSRVAIPVVVIVAVLSTTVESMPLPAPVAAAVGAVVVGGIVALPGVVDRD